MRHSNLTFGGAFGSIAAGHTGPSTNGTNDDLSQSGLAVDMACSNASKPKSCPDFTAGRRGVIRYSTPSIGAIGISGSFAPGFGTDSSRLAANSERLIRAPRQLRGGRRR